jgi:hypothetical protein
MERKEEEEEMEIERKMLRTNSLFGRGKSRRAFPHVDIRT